MSEYEHECEFSIKGIDEDIIKFTFEKVFDKFENEGYDFDRKIKIFNEGRIKIKGYGEDGRCAFCKYFREAILEHYNKNKLKGSIVFLGCPYNTDEIINDKL